MTIARVPTEAELVQINKFVPVGYAPITAEEVGVVSVIVANNLLTYDYQKWAIADLKIMPELIVGKQATLNHDSWSVEKVFGKIFNVSEETKRTIPLAMIKSANAYQADINSSIVKKEGYTSVTADIYYPISQSADNSVLSALLGDPLVVEPVSDNAQLNAQVAAIAKRLNEVVSALVVSTDHEVSEEIDSVENRIRFSLYDRVSLGSFNCGTLRCPDCKCENGFPLDSYATKGCELDYLIPEPDYGLEPNMIIDCWDGEKTVAPYVVRSDLKSAEEISFVLAGNLPLAATVKG